MEGVGPLVQAGKLVAGGSSHIILLTSIRALLYGFSQLTSS